MNTSSWLDGHARFRPQAEAILDVDAGRRWTWRELSDEARGWAALLRSQGVARGDRVALLARNRGETFALLFACARLGAILAPLCWRLSGPEIAWQLADLAPAVCLGEGDLLSVLAARHPRVLDLDEEPAASEGIEPVDLPPEAPWLILYTSGSSGRPRGALLTHRQLAANAVNTQLACDLDPDSATLTFTPLFHTGGLNCLSTPLLWRGGRVVLTRGLDPGQALRLVAEQRITHLMGVPTIYAMLADHPAFAAADLASVRDALCGGAPLPLPLLERYLDRGIPLRQGFGMTEVGPNCFSLPRERLLDRKGSVGLPIHHLEARIVAEGRVCGPGETGELQLRGEVVFGGYWNAPEATAAAFDGGWFSTGDLLSRDAEGFFYVRGRAKEMFISGGENVCPAEVEAAILDHPAVAQAAVVGVPDERWGEVGVAWVEPRPERALAGDELRGFLDGRLARFKLPKRIEILAELPRTGSGKIDKVALRAGL